MHKNFRPIIVVSVTNNERHGVVRSTVSMAIVFNESRSSKSLTAIQGEKILSFPGSPLSEILYYILYFWPESSFSFWAEAERKDAEVYRPGPLVDSPSSSSGCQHNTPEFGGGGNKMEGGVKREPPATWTQPHT